MSERDLILDAGFDALAEQVAPAIGVTPDGRPLRAGMCTCAVHCVNSPYHERACCADHDRWCDCWCHADQYKVRAGAQA